MTMMYFDHCQLSQHAYNTNHNMTISQLMTKVENCRERQIKRVYTWYTYECSLFYLDAARIHDDTSTLYNLYNPWWFPYNHGHIHGLSHTMYPLKCNQRPFAHTHVSTTTAQKTHYSPSNA